MDEKKQRIYDAVNAMRVRRAEEELRLTDKCSLDDYRTFVRRTDAGGVWTEALQKALDEHEIVVIPASDEVYYIDRTVVIPGNRKIIADGAVIRLTEECKVIMLRNASTANGTHHPITGEGDENIIIRGGSWEESNTRRLGYGNTGKYDEERSFYGVSTLFFFNHMKGLTIENVTFSHTAGFAVQAGDLTDGLFFHIRFVSCFADGIHLNGNSENLFISDVRGEVGDDLVALNMYDWQDSSVDFGPIRNVVCENLDIPGKKGYYAMRIEPGTYYYDDGTPVDCGLFGAVFHDLGGVMTYKLYYQTPRYRIGSEPERGNVGSADDLYFENVRIDLADPIDGFPEYKNSDPVRGAFGAFEIGANIGHITFDNVDLTYDPKRYPLACLVTCGPKSVIWDNYEIFDPYVSCEVVQITFKNIMINGYPAEDLRTLIHETVFHDINADGHSTGSGKISRIVWDGIRVK